MFNNPGKQIQRLAKIFFWLSFIVSFVAGYIVANLFFSKSEYYIPFLVIIILIVLVVLWIPIIFIYAFGALVENSEIIRHNTQFELDTLSLMESHLRDISVYSSFQSVESESKEK